MPDYKEMYYCLFRSFSDAIEAIEQLNFGECKQILIHAQQEAEEIYVSSEDE